MPSSAERARTVVHVSPSLHVRTALGHGDVDLHGTDPRGSIVLVVPERHPVVDAVRRVDDDLAVVVDAVDLCPLPVADRVRERVQLGGWVHEPPEHLRRELAVVVASRDGAEDVLDIGHGRTVLYVEVAEVLMGTGFDSGAEDEPDAIDGEDYAAATPDPLADVEAGLLEHMVSEHADEVATLAALIPADLLRTVRRVVPVRLDRYGLVLRAILPSGRARDVRLPFDAPIRCPRDLPERMRDLLGRCPLTVESGGGA